MRITIKTDNAAFCDPSYEDRDSYDDADDAVRATEAHATACRAEVARILRDIANDLGDGAEDGTCHDANGNTVGTWSL